MLTEKDPAEAQKAEIEKQRNIAKEKGEHNQNESLRTEENKRKGIAPDKI